MSDDFFPREFCEHLLLDLHRLNEAGILQKAAIGRGSQYQIQSEVRADFTHWLHEPGENAIQEEFFTRMEVLRRCLNENFFLGVQELEAHYALYPPGGGYAKHFDQHLGTSFRKMTFILYLNAQWEKGHGGELVLYKPEEDSQILQEIEPVMGRMVLFRSEIFPHEVLTCLSPRMSLTGWFRTSH